MRAKSDFTYSSAPEPHRIRTREILSSHPEVRSLIGKNPLTLFFITGLVLGMVLLAWLVKDSAWWVVIVTAYFVGAFFSHALFVMIHECAHNLIFKKKSLNTVAGIFANLPHMVPSSVSFARYHIRHHSFQGVYELDGDLPDKWEAKLISHSFAGKCIWLLIYPVFQLIRTFRLKEIKPIDGWIIANFLVQLAFDLAVWFLLGPKAFFFFLFSFFFSVGLHPLGARWIQEHYLTLDENQETYSYYGPLNTVAFNVGYHNEHHDFPSVPWNKLPNLKKLAPTYYDSLLSHTSCTRLFFRFLFDKKISVYCRMLRDNRNKIQVSDPSTPDTDMIMMSAQGK